MADEIDATLNRHVASSSVRPWIAADASLKAKSAGIDWRGASGVATQFSRHVGESFNSFPRARFPPETTNFPQATFLCFCGVVSRFWIAEERREWRQSCCFRAAKIAKAFVLFLGSGRGVKNGRKSRFIFESKLCSLEHKRTQSARPYGRPPHTVTKIERYLTMTVVYYYFFVVVMTCL